METRTLEIGDVLQINPTHSEFGGMLLVVTEPKDWGAQGYLMSYYDFYAVRYNNKAFLRVKFEDMEYVGGLQWMPNDVLHTNQEGEGDR